MGSSNSSVVRFPEEWTVHRVGDIASVKGGKRLPPGTSLVEFKTKHPYLRVVDFREGRIDKSAIMYVPESVQPKIARYTISSRDIYISIVGTIGLVGTVNDELDGANLTENAAKLCDLTSDVDRDFLVYFLQSAWGQNQIDALAVGSTQRKLALSRIKDIRIPLPPVREQRAIAHVLRAFDDKIELNRRMSETLEQLARAEFERVVTEKPTDGVPAGEEWTVAKVDDLARISSGKRPPSRYPRQSPETGVPIWGSNGPMAYTNDSLINERILLTGRVGTLGNVFRVAPPSWPSDNTLVIRPTNEQSFEYLYFFLQTLDLASLNRGSTQPMLAQADVRSQPIPVPPARVLSRYNGFASRLFARIDSATTESQVLTNIRDSLLPKLISGELRIPEAEQLVSEVA